MARAPLPRRKATAPLDLARLFQIHTEQEDFRSYMYRDTEGHVTVGYGFLLPSAKAAERLPFLMQTAGPNPRTRPATAQEIAAAFALVQSRPFGQTITADAFRGLTPTFLSEPVARTIWRQRVREAERLVRAFPVLRDYASFPPSAKLAIVDMAYQHGPRGAIQGANADFIKAVRSREWMAAATFVARPETSPRRNRRRRELFTAAAAEE